MSRSITHDKSRSVTVTLILLAIPSLLEHILETLMQYVDTAMVGHLGKEATSAVSCTTTISWLVGTFSWSIGMAFLALISRSHGAGLTDKVKRYTGFAFLSALIFGTLTAVISCSLSPFIPMWMIRLPLTYITINYLHLGLNEVWLCMIADNVCMAVLLALCYLLTRKRGLNNK
ncbi:MAG: MATE family efflux transporter [Clostridiales bacterium]|nr:MATE family efflux transporter [Clostridiales bacterium]